MEVVLVVGLGGAVGAILRWWVGVLMNHLSATSFFRHFSGQLDRFICDRAAADMVSGKITHQRCFTHWYFGWIVGWVHDLFGVFDGGCKYDDGWLLWPRKRLCSRDGCGMSDGNMGRGNAGPLSVSWTIGTRPCWIHNNSAVTLLALRSNCCGDVIRS